MRMNERLIVALDYPVWPDAAKLVGSLPDASHFKVGLELYLASRGEAVRELKSMGKRVFLDLKFHDIPQTVAGAVGQAVLSGADMINVHASGGPAMMKAALAARDRASEGMAKPLLIAVTVLTSLDDTDIKLVGFADATASDAAVRLAELSKGCGMDGVVCSPHEIRPMRQRFGKDFKLVCPGVRPSWSEKGDQKRVFTPSDAMGEGADYIVVGRPITRAEDQLAAYRSIIREMEAGTDGR